jgi:hypothetical protein
MSLIFPLRSIFRCGSYAWIEGAFWTGRWFVSAGLLFSFLSCAPIGLGPGSAGDLYSRTYGVEFKTFHPKLNSALQEFAQEHKGNSFQVMRLGSDGLIIRGLYRRDWDQARFLVNLHVFPVPQDRTRIDIRINSDRPDASAEDLAMAAGGLFQIIEDRIPVLSMKP